MTAEVQVVSADANYEDPVCGRCGTTLPGERFGELVEQRWAEPGVACGACGWSAPLGDWPTEYPPGLVGAPSIAFHNWSVLREDVVAGIITRLGGRCRSFWQHL